jgi:hypothetical protein
MKRQNNQTTKQPNNQTTKQQPTTVRQCFQPQTKERFYQKIWTEDYHQTFNQMGQNSS